VAVGAAPTKMARSRNTQRKHSISLGAVGTLWNVNLPCNLGKVSFNVSVPVKTGIAAKASCRVLGKGQGSQSSHGASGMRRQGQNRGC
jgi:hypothetical protein